jgi:hypothetical protein
MVLKIVCEIHGFYSWMGAPIQEEYPKEEDRPFLFGFVYIQWNLENKND